jgi:hypothetical protein
MFKYALLSNKLQKKKAQVWVETAIYTLIGLTIIAILLSAATPQILKMKDRGIVRQTSEALLLLDSKITEIKQAPGNIRIVDIKIAKGRLEIDAEKDAIRYILEDTRLKLSEPGVEVQEGKLLIKTEEYGSKFTVIITMDYKGSLDITHDIEESLRTLQAGTAPYKIQIENIGDNEVGQPTHIHFNIL